MAEVAACPEGSEQTPFFAGSGYYFAYCAVPHTWYAADVVPEGFVVATCDAPIYYSGSYACEEPFVFAGAVGGEGGDEVDLEVAGGIFAAGFVFVAGFFVLGFSIRALLRMLK